MKRLLLILTFFGLALNLSAQSVNTSKGHIENCDIVTITYGCKNFPSNNHYFSHDSILENFYTQVENSGCFFIPAVDTIGYLKELLARAREKSQHSCLLPFLRIFDKRADEVHDYTCFTSSYVVPHKAYCDMPAIQFITLFTVQFSFIEKYVLNSKQKFENIKLRKKLDTLNKYSLSQHDYNSIYDLYNNWLDNYRTNRQNSFVNPLANSEYEWVLETSPKLTKRRLKWLEERRRAH